MSDFPRWPNIPSGSNVDSAIKLMERWANRLLDVLGSDNIKLRNTVVKNESDSISIQGRIRLNSNLTDPDTTETFVKGQIRFNASTNKFQGYDGTGWRDFH